MSILVYNEEPHFENTGGAIYHNFGWSYFWLELSTLPLPPAMSWFSLSAIAEKAKVVDVCVVC